MKTNHLDNYSNAYDNDFTYSLDNELILNWYPKRILEQVTGDSILELGIGHGYTSIIFSNNFKRHVVIDGSQEIISDFKKKYKEAEKMNIVYNYFEDFESEEKFDVIVMGFILEHVDNPDLILKKYKSFLKPNGKIFIAVPNSDALNKRIGFEAGMLESLSKLSDADLLFGHQRIFNLSSLKELCTRNNYYIKRIEGIFMKPITTQQIRDLKLSDEIMQAMLKVGINYPELCVAMLMEVSLEAK